MLPFLKSLFPEENASSEPNTADQGVRFVTTQGINYYLDECLKKAQKEIILIAPYIKIEPRLREILMDLKLSSCAVNRNYGTRFRTLPLFFWTGQRFTPNAI